MQNHEESLALLRCIKNTVFGIGLMVFSIGLLAFGYVWAQNTAALFAVFFYGGLLLFLAGAVWWWTSRRPCSPESGPRDTAPPSDTDFK